MKIPDLDTNFREKRLQYLLGNGIARYKTLTTEYFETTDFVREGGQEFLVQSPCIGPYGDTTTLYVNTSELSDEDADILSERYVETVIFENLSTLSPGVARAFAVDDFAEYRDDALYLSFNSITSLSDVSAEALSLHHGSLSLDGLTTLSDASAESLSRHQGSLSLDGLTTLSDASAESLSRHQGDISLDGLTTLSEVAITYPYLLPIIKNNSKLQFRFECINEAVATAFIGTNNRKLISKAWSISDAAAKIIARHPAQHSASLILDGLTNISDNAAESLSLRKGGISLDGLTNISEKVAEHFAQHHGDLFLNGLTSISDKTAEFLAQHHGNLYLNGLTSISDKTAESLSHHHGNLMINGLTSLSDNAAESFSQHQSDLYLSGLITISDAAALAIRKHKMYILLPAEI
jgi:hypothetical protein